MPVVVVVSVSANLRISKSTDAGRYGGNLGIYESADNAEVAEQLRGGPERSKEKDSQPGHQSGSLVFKLMSENDFTEPVRALAEEVGAPSQTSKAR